MKKFLKRISAIAACIVMVVVAGLSLTACDTGGNSNENNNTQNNNNENKKVEYVETDAVAYAKKLLEAGNATNYTVSHTEQIGDEVNTSVTTVSFYDGLQRLYFKQGSTTAYYELKAYSAYRLPDDDNPLTSPAIRENCVVLDRYSPSENVYYETIFDTIDEVYTSHNTIFISLGTGNSLQCYTYELALKGFIDVGEINNKFGYENRYTITGSNGNYTLTYTLISGETLMTMTITTANDKVQKFEVTAYEDGMSGTMTEEFTYNTQAKVIANKNSYTRSPEKDPILFPNHNSDI